MSRGWNYWVGVAGGVGIGGIVGFLAGMASIEKKVREEYVEANASYRRAVDLARERPVTNVFNQYKDTVKEKDELEVAEGKDPFEKLVGGPQVYEAPEDGTIMTSPVQITPVDQEPVKNDYHKAIEAVDTPTEVFVDGGVNDYGVSYIEEEEYHEEDGFEKSQIILMMDEHNATFFEGGQKIHDWDEKLGDSIIVDFYKHVPPGVPQVLYVRNHRTGTDYEVIKETP